MENVVLDDSLYLEFRKYREGADSKSYSHDKIAEILRFSGNSVLTNVEQWKRLGLDLNSQTGQALLHQRTKKATLEDLAKATRYKIILTDDPAKRGFPYVNIDNDEIEMVLGGFVMCNASRAKAKAHLKALCRDARKVILYDKYFSSSDCVSDNAPVLNEILPDRKLELHYHQDSEHPHITAECASLIQTKLPGVTLCSCFLYPHHDRYLIIDDKIEIILTSGFSYLTGTLKEITYIVREYGNRFCKKGQSQRHSTSGSR